jgi:hypothetical protein
MEQNKAHKPIFKRWWFWVLAVVVLIIIIAAVSGGGDNKNAAVSPGAQQQNAAPSSAAPAAPTATSADIQLSSGNYTAGMDFPAGTYDITVVSGAGNVSSSNMYSGGLNATMGTEEANKTLGTDLYEQSYANIKLPDGTVLSVSGGVVIRITSGEASTKPLKQRGQTITETVALGSGNFVSGKDFPAGTYDVIAVSGGGNVSSDNMYSGGINAVMGPEGANADLGTSLYEQAYKNVELPQGTTLTISGVKINLVPSK